MIKKLIRLTIAVLILFSVAGLTACNGDLAQYKTDAKAELDTCVATKDEADYSGDNWTKVLGFAAAGKTAIDDAADKAGVDSAVTTAKMAIDAVEKEGASMEFPSVLEIFVFSDFTEEFFEGNTLFLVPLNHGYLLYDHVEFYAVSAKDGKLNFVIEITDPIGGGEEAIDSRVFVVCISNEIVKNFEIGERIKFNTYDFSAGNVNNPPFELPPLSNRDWLAEIRENSVEHRVGLLSHDSFKPMSNDIVAVSSRQALNDLLV